MSVLTILTRKSPTLAGIEFDAVLEDVIEGSVLVTGYTLESGARAADHRVITPIRYNMIASISNNPLKASVTDFLGGAASNVIDGAVVAGIAGLSAGFLAGSNDTRASAALNALFEIMITGEPFDVDAVDIQLSNMVIVDITRVRNPTNENALVVNISLQEYPSLETLFSEASTQPKQDQLTDGDQAKWSAAGFIEKGEQIAKDVGDSINNAVTGIFN